MTSSFGKITASGSAGRLKNDRPKDTTPTNAAFGLPGVASYVQQQVFKDSTGELRFSSNFSGPLQVVLGGFYEQDRTDFQDAAVLADPTTGDLVCSFDADCVAMGQLSRVEYATATTHDINQYAVYGQADYKLLDNLTATAGSATSPPISRTPRRRSRTSSTSSFQRQTTPYGIENSRGSESKPSFNFALLWKPTSDVSLYARAASGFRVGGVNDAVNAANNFHITIPGSYGPDSLWTTKPALRPICSTASSTSTPLSTTSTGPTSSCRRPTSPVRSATSSTPARPTSMASNCRRAPIPSAA